METGILEAPTQGNHLAEPLEQRARVGLLEPRVLRVFKARKGILEHEVLLAPPGHKGQLARRAPQQKCRQPTRAAVLWSG